ncbi:MAG: 2,3,4,5-tetrahydropyridine-2,6-dicarboxylate N-succinyltransferase [Halioglobus sp.]|nr:2,3,4,5-tetrahydropyridine-2,6-dicarboxylate N-succinyltransferase [Halioglobus sp.]
MTASNFAFGLGVGTHNSNAEWLELYYPLPVLAPSEALAGAAKKYDNDRTLGKDQLETLAHELDKAGEREHAMLARRVRDSGRPAACVLLDNEEPPSNVPEAYLKLHLISHRLVRPHGTKLDGLFAILPNVAWTGEGAIDIAELPERQLAARLRGEVLEVSSIDKFPKMSNYVVPAGVRIAHTARVRLGAYLGEGTTVMHEGFVNFNAGTEGPGMIEGRISAGVMIGAHSDLGGGASTMGTLSGGGKLINGMGEGCLVGANGGTGIPLGDRCTIEAGLYITAGTRVTLIDAKGHPVETVKAQKLAGKPDLLFRRNSTTGTVECLTNRSSVELNDELHAHN